MAKITGPLYSQKASGSIADVLTFSERKSGAQVRFQKKQADHITAGRAEVRGLYRLITARWRCMTSGEKAVYNSYVAENKLQMTGWDYFVKLCIENPYLNLGLAGYWPCDEESGDILHDFSGNSHDATLKPVTPADQPQRVSSFNENGYKALYYNGMSAYAEVPSSATLKFTAHDYTLCRFSKPIYPVGNYPSIIRRVGAFTLYQQKDSGVLRAEVYDSIGPKYTYSVETVELDKWHFVTLSYTNSDRKIRFTIDGVPCTYSVQQTLATNFPDSNNVTRFGDTGIYYWKGTLDEIMFYNRLLPIEEIKEIQKAFYTNKN